MARKFRITDEGEHRLDTHRAEAIQGLEKVMSDWDPEEVATFAAYLKRFNTDIENLDERPWPRPDPEHPDRAHVHRAIRTHARRGMTKPGARS